MEERVLLTDLVTALQPGNVIRCFEKGNPNHELRHIRAIVDEEFVVYRVWLKHKQRWSYQVESMWRFSIGWEQGVYTLDT